MPQRQVGLAPMPHPLLSPMSIPQPLAPMPAGTLLSAQAAEEDANQNQKQQLRKLNRGRVTYNGGAYTEEFYKRTVMEDPVIAEFMNPNR